MSKRRRKRRSRTKAAANAATPAPEPKTQAPAATASQAKGPTPGADATEGSGAAKSAGQEALRPWRDDVTALRAKLRAFARDRFAPAVAPFADVDPRDRERLEEDFVCSRGSSGEPHSILRRFTEQTPELASTTSDQLLRWERERGRGVFLIQDCTRDRMIVWDPIEGAALTVHMLTRLPRDLVRTIETGTVATLSYAPWMARIVALDPPELFADPRAAQLFEQQVREGGQSWHPAPPPAPKPSPRSSRS